MEAQLRSVDLNLLPMLRELLRTRNVSRAAAALGLSQSATSEALKRLRMQFGDDLLVRFGRTMTPTHFALSLAPMVERMLSMIEEVVKEDFNSASVSRQFVVATMDSCVVDLGPALLARISDVSPNTTVQFLDLQESDPQSLESGVLDLAISPDGLFANAPLNSTFLYQEDLVCVARRGTGLSEKPLTERALQSLATVAFGAHARDVLLMSRFTNGKNDVIRMPQFLPQAFLVNDCDAVALLPSSLANRLASVLGLDLFDPPWDARSLAFHAYWGDAHVNDADHRWFREPMAAVIKEGRA